MNLDLAMFSPRIKVGSAVEQYYTQSKHEPFGLNKRTRRIAKGNKAVTRPDGKQD